MRNMTSLSKMQLVLHHCQQYHLSRQNTQEHCQRINRRIAYCRSIVTGCLGWHTLVQEGRYYYPQLIPLK